MKNGDRTSISQPMRPGVFRDESAKAAATPSTIATSPDAAATNNERTVALIHVSDVKYSRYQFSVHPSGGHPRKLDFVNDTGMRKMVGSTRNPPRNTKTIASVVHLEPRAP